MANGTKTHTSRHGTLKLYDLALAHTHTVTYTDGDLQIGEDGADVSAFKNRGVFGSPPDVAFGDEKEIPFSFTARVTEGLSAAEATILDVARDDGGSTSYVETTWSPVNGAGEVPLYGLEWVSDPSAYTGGKLIRIRLPYCRFKWSAKEGIGGTILSISGVCFANRATITAS